MSFPELLDAALVGTIRRDPPAVLPALGNLAPESRLLRGAGYEGLRRLAGRPARAPAGAGARPTPCPPETLPEVAPAAAARRREIRVRCPEHRAEWRRLHARVIAGERCTWEFDMIGLAGTRRSLETHAVPLPLPGSI